MLSSFLVRSVMFGNNRLNYSILFFSVMFGCNQILSGRYFRFNDYQWMSDMFLSYLLMFGSIQVRLIEFRYFFGGVGNVMFALMLSLLFL